MRILFYTLFTFGLGWASASATPVEFVQDGWWTGGPLQVSFSGDDTNGNGTLEQLELSAFRASWMTPFGAATNWALPDIEPDGFLFTDLNNYLFFIRNDDFSMVSSAFEGEALASVFDQFLFPVSNSDALPTAVPEPSGLCVLGLSALALGRLLTKSRVGDLGSPADEGVRPTSESET